MLLSFVKRSAYSSGSKGSSDCGTYIYSEVHYLEDVCVCVFHLYLPPLRVPRVLCRTTAWHATSFYPVAYRYPDSCGSGGPSDARSPSDLTEIGCFRPGYFWCDLYYDEYRLSSTGSRCGWESWVRRSRQNLMSCLTITSAIFTELVVQYATQEAWRSCCLIVLK